MEGESSGDGLPEFWCHICQLACLSAINLHSHFIGRKHKLAEEALRFKDAAEKKPTEEKAGGGEGGEAEEAQAAAAPGSEGDEAQAAAVPGSEGDEAQAAAAPGSDGEEAQVEVDDGGTYKTLDELLAGVQDVEAALGLEYIYHFKKDGISRYDCQLCSSCLPQAHMFTHILGVKHRTNYLNRHHPEVCINITQGGIIRGKKKFNRLRQQCLELERKHGRKQINVVTGEYSGFTHSQGKAPIPRLAVIQAKTMDMDFTSDEIEEPKQPPPPPPPKPKEPPAAPLSFLEIRRRYEERQKMKAWERPLTTMEDDDEEEKEEEERASDGEGEPDEDEEKRRREEHGVFLSNTELFIFLENFIPNRGKDYQWVLTAAMKLNNVVEKRKQQRLEEEIKRQEEEKEKRLEEERKRQEEECKRQEEERKRQEEERKRQEEEKEKKRLEEEERKRKEEEERKKREEEEEKKRMLRARNPDEKVRFRIATPPPETSELVTSGRLSLLQHKFSAKVRTAKRENQKEMVGDQQMSADGESDPYPEPDSYPAANPGTDTGAANPYMDQAADTFAEDEDMDSFEPQKSDVANPIAQMSEELPPEEETQKEKELGDRSARDWGDRSARDWGDRSAMSTREWGDRSSREWGDRSTKRGSYSDMSSGDRRGYSNMASRSAQGNERFQKQTFLRSSPLATVKSPADSDPYRGPGSSNRPSNNSNWEYQSSANDYPQEEYMETDPSNDWPQSDASMHYGKSNRWGAATRNSDAYGVRGNASAPAGASDSQGFINAPYPQGGRSDGPGTSPHPQGFRNAPYPQEGRSNAPGAALDHGFRNAPEPYQQGGRSNVPGSTSDPQGFRNAPYPQGGRGNAPGTASDPQGFRNAPYPQGGRGNAPGSTSDPQGFRNAPYPQGGRSNAPGTASDPQGFKNVPYPQGGRSNAPATASGPEGFRYAPYPQVGRSNVPGTASDPAPYAQRGRSNVPGSSDPEGFRNAPNPQGGRSNVPGTASTPEGLRNAPYPQGGRSNTPGTASDPQGFRNAPYPQGGRSNAPGSTSDPQGFRNAPYPQGGRSNAPGSTSDPQGFRNAPYPQGGRSNAPGSTSDPQGFRNAPYPQGGRSNAPGSSMDPQGFRNAPARVSDLYDMSRGNPPAPGSYPQGGRSHAPTRDQTSAYGPVGSHAGHTPETNTPDSSESPQGPSEGGAPGGRVTVMSKFFSSIAAMDPSEVEATLLKITASNPAFKGMYVPALVQFLKDSGKIRTDKST